MYNRITNAENIKQREKEKEDKAKRLDEIDQRIDHKIKHYMGSQYDILYKALTIMIIGIIVIITFLKLLS